MTVSDEPPVRKGWIHGGTVDRASGTIRYTSVSATTLAMNCLKRYVYSYRFGIKDPPTEHTDRGTARHAEMEAYLKTGSRAHMSQQALQAIPFVPDPGSDLMIEWDLLKRPHQNVIIDASNSSEFLKNAPLKLAGIPVLGAIDVLNLRGISKDDGVLITDGCPEVHDHKFPNKANGKKPHELLKTPQMAGYGKWLLNVLPETERVRLTHGIFPVSGNSWKSTIIVDRDQIERQWEQFEAVGRSMKDAIAEPDVHKVDRNDDFCHSYGRPCPAKGKCKGDALAELIGADSATTILNDIEEPLVQLRTNKNMPSITERLAAQRAVQVAATAPTVKDEMKRLKREDALAKYPDILTLFAALEAHNLGFPVLTDEMASAKTDIEGTDYRGGALSGSGDLAAYTMSTIEDLREAVRMLAGDAPATTETTTVTEEDVTAASAAIAEVASDAPKKRGRKAKDEPVVNNYVMQAKEGVVVRDDSRTVDGRAPSASTGNVKSDVINLYVDCLPSMQHESFWPIVNKIMIALAADSGASDVRLADQNGKYGFGRWKAALAACLRESKIPGGHYVLDGSFGEIAQEVISVMRERAVASGGLFVRGVR